MKRVVYQPADALISWAEARCGGAFRPDAKAIGLERDGQLIASVVFDNHSPGSCCISVASDGSRRWLTRDFLVHVFAYPFLQCGYRRLTALIAASNADSQRFCTSCGFTHEGTMRAGAPGGEDMLILGLLREECRFLPAGIAPRAAV